ncbi:FAD-dependent 5-carboxymethylaminomethyl-2-thiouridine(34) oxidoreductase MnmC [Marinobacter sp. BSs20148]|jgi:tRNA 5-methylaminomethyl-2-thiouridine biosynthesis bifunctional protein|uniref:FAD-dependent 5-carboxymethylaminomethyl-2-thiouridine(34) oxidoreductase MnmC n=2 Tax=Marinobacter TaxID=2742 RepID=UPI0002776F0D|nr:FAD-dependent 5-carboxymethylaminomethyl-2-thiouridine(34) oxidoreductase MnmC [Marinobacter sp. BSs20148]AFP30660.1 tRNA 5-methylaminomethyl-2-thiouridine biosynthesis bifunctional protein mnmC [Marinobacter sp. BSs20148]
MTGPALDHAKITWLENGRFYLNGFSNRIYDELSLETIQIQHVEQITNSQQTVFAAAEFDLGLDFLACWQNWMAQRPEPGNVLHFISHQQHPLSRDDLKRAVSLWPQLAEFSEQLVQAWPPAVAGLHRLVFADGQVRLTLHFGPQGDAWHDLSKPDPQPACRPDSVVIIGAGIAGACLARNLAERGVPVQILDSLTPGQAASGNKQGALYAKLGVDYSPQTALALSALLFAERFYQQFQAHQSSTGHAPFFHATGLLQLAFNDHEQQRQHKFLARNHYPAGVLYPVTAQQATDLVGVTVHRGGLWFPQGGWLAPSQLCQTLVQHPLITIHPHCKVTGLVRSDGLWQISARRSNAATGSDKLFNLESDQLVICAGAQTLELFPQAWLAPGERLRLKPIRGQVSHLPAAAITSPNAVICGSRYLNPQHDGIAVTGATFDLRDENPLPTTASHQENLTELDHLLPGVVNINHPAVADEILQGRVAFRCTTHDYQPVAGAVGTQSMNTNAGAWMFTGLGSKGLTYAPLLAEYLADRMCNQPAALPDALAHRLRVERVLQQE